MSGRLTGALLALVVASIAGPAVAQPVGPRDDGPLMPPAPPVRREPIVVISPRPPSPDPVLLDLGVRVGVALRLGDAPSIPIATRNGGMIGLVAAIAPSRRISIGAAYEHTGIGTERGAGSAATAEITRTLDAIWATVRLALFFDDRASFGVLLGPGAVLQHAHVDGVLAGSSGSPGTPFSCTENGGPDIGVRAGLGSEVRMGPRFVVGLDMVFDALHLSSDSLGTCIPGAGSMVVFGARASLAYRFDVSRAVR